MAERAIKKKRKNIRISIIRPSIIIGSYKEPVQGWTDSIAAGGVIIFGIMNGYMKTLKFGTKVIMDIVPVDYVTNVILASTAYTAL